MGRLPRKSADTVRFGTIPEEATGLALITVTPDGENGTALASGANKALRAEMVITSLDAGDPPALVVAQTEISVPVIEAVAAWCQTHGVRLTLNYGPYLPLSAGALETTDPLVLNEHEARDLCGLHSDERGENLALEVSAATRARSVVVTMGAKGTQVADGTGTIVVPPVRASLVVDTTGAGDSFMGTLAAALVSGKQLAEAVRVASCAATQSVSWVGARPPLV
jgi:ribokinase